MAVDVVFHQILQSSAVVQQHLQAAAGILAEQAVDLAAIQEIDRKAWWTSRLNQATFMAEQAGYANSVVGDQVAGMGLHYGTALMSHAPLTQAQAYAFAAGPFYPSQGFTVARWSPDGQRTATVATLHFHFIGGTRQRQQAEFCGNDASTARSLYNQWRF